MAEAIEPAVPDVLTCHPQGGPDQGEWLPSSKQGTDMSQSSLTVEQNAAFLMKAKGLCAVRPLATTYARWRHHKPVLTRYSEAATPSATVA
jgi:hypothetical protein